ncbi:hypothetical protein K457DRAFT_24707 [Linnemannia elongata AG-77]|uniref:F-box domain-containing protein n=1 Tax=Linnemannia elongata AG-77 TaxID=1314771 RepID=A0A197JFA5_9FUNG|nr:hypothetical protein K457DRAFT_24707 [Linnemannia elongata AG-77]
MNHPTTTFFFILTTATTTTTKTRHSLAGSDLTKMSEPVSFASLPLEIQGMVASFLGQHDLVRCVLVCHDWRDCFSHSLWGYLIIDNYSSICFCLKYCNQKRKANNHLFMESARSGAFRIYGHNLRSLEISVNDDDMLREYLELAPPTFPYMTSLHVVGRVTEDDLMADLIRRCTGGLKQLVCEVFFAKESTFSSLEIQRLLCSAPKLRCFHILPGVPRWDLNYIFTDKTSRVLMLNGSPQESIDLQRQVYTQLGRLNDRHHIPEFLQQDCLSMTLESGMALLHGLKNLRIVDLVHMIVGFGDEERQWVKEFWPEATVMSDDFGRLYFDSD